VDEAGNIGRYLETIQNLDVRDRPRNWSCDRPAHLKSGISNYSNKNWSELYAESFALYTTDPATLKLLRPNPYWKNDFPVQSSNDDTIYFRDANAVDCYIVHPQEPL
jgi:hypothetical protein